MMRVGLMGFRLTERWGFLTVVHSRIATTSRYAHLDDGHVLEAAEQIGSLLADAMGEKDL